MSCSPDSIIYDEVRGEYICIETGEVLIDHVPDFGPEWRVFVNGEVSGRERAGAPVTNKVHDYGLNTRVDRSSVKGRKLDTLNERIRRLNVREKRHSKALTLMNDVISRLDIPASHQLKEATGLIINKLVKNGLIKKKNMRAMVAASIIIAAKNLGIPINNKRVMELCHVTTQEVWNAELKICRDSGVRVRAKPLDPRTYLGNMASKIGLHQSTIALAAKLLARAKAEGLTSGKGPKGLAAASLYIASLLLGERRTQRDISTLVEVSEVTIRNRYRDLINNLVIYVNL